MKFRTVLPQRTGTKHKTLHAPGEGMKAKRNQHPNTTEQDTGRRTDGGEYPLSFNPSLFLRKANQPLARAKHLQMMSRSSGGAWLE